MCGRYQLEIDMDDILNFIDILGEVREKYHEDELKDMVHEKRDFTPGSKTIILTPEGIKKPLWGFPLDKKLVFNARSESIFEKRMFSEAVRKRRCLVPANLFYEWQGTQKIKHEVKTGDKIMYLGGIYSRYPSEKGELEDRFSIITQASEGDMLEIHPRTPLIIESNNLRRFLNPGASDNEIKQILSKTPAHLLINRADGPSQLSFL
jgi:putative SOS response-associated peptidase YedK